MVEKGTALFDVVSDVAKSGGSTSYVVGPSTTIPGQVFVCPGTASKVVMSMLVMRQRSKPSRCLLHWVVHSDQVCPADTLELSFTQLSAVVVFCRGKSVLQPVS